MPKILSELYREKKKMFVNPGRELPLSILANILKLETQAQ